MDDPTRKAYFRPVATEVIISLFPFFPKPFKADDRNMFSPDMLAFAACARVGAANRNAGPAFTLHHVRLQDRSSRQALRPKPCAAKGTTKSLSYLSSVIRCGPETLVGDFGRSYSLLLLENSLFFEIFSLLIGVGNCPKSSCSTATSCYEIGF